jgi:uncharacterized protein (TIGR00369 family)
MALPMSKDYLEIAKKVTEAIRHCNELDMRVISADKGKLTLELPYSENIVGNPETGVIHGGAITTLMDSTCGFTAPLALDGFQICPTLDLRIDYMAKAIPHRSVFGSAEAYRVTENVIFVRGVAWQDSPDQPIAHCVATFMRLDPASTTTASTTATTTNNKQ